MIWGVIPAFFKAYWNTNETLFTLMMNYVATQVITYCIIFWENPKGSNSVGTINSSTKGGWIPQLFGLDYGWNLVIVLALTVAMFIYLKYSKQGYEIAVVGESENTARYAGINVKRVILRTMALSGAICGIAGFIIVGGASHTISTSTAGWASGCPVNGCTPPHWPPSTTSVRTIPRPNGSFCSVRRV